MKYYYHKLGKGNNHLERYLINDKNYFYITYNFNYITELKSEYQNDEDIIEQLLLYIIDVYGYVDYDNFRSWFKSNFNLGN
jgi:hypothetical protein